jgi:nucleoid-associated protein YgaU
MGKVEKIVVLGVLFVIVSILAVSMDRGLGGGMPDAGGADVVNAAAPVHAPQQAKVNPRERGRRIPVDGDATQATSGTVAAPLLSAEVQDPQVGQGALPEVPSAPLSPAEIAEDWDLVTLEGLEVHPLDSQLMLYTAGAGEDFVSLSERLYGDAMYAHTLRCNNEGTLDIREGQVLEVPVMSDIAQDHMHEVSTDESLWKIAERAYDGKGHLWRNIYDANPDVLGSPDDLQPGMILRVPPLQE